MKKLHTISMAVLGLSLLVQLSVPRACAQENKKTSNTTYVRTIDGTDAFDAAIAAAGDTLVMVDLYADWCAPCRRLSPLLEEIAKEKRDQVLTFKVNVDQNRALAQRYQVRSIPYVVFIKKGKMLTSILGLRDKASYTTVIDSIAPVSGD